jgi:hypothetical protein
LGATDSRRLRHLLLGVATIGVSYCALLAQETADLADPHIKAAQQEISAGQIQSDIEKLVSFQTRSTISGARWRFDICWTRDWFGAGVD